MAAVSGTDAWAVGSRPDRAGFPVTLAEHWNGTAWRQVPAPSPKPPLPPSPADVLYAVATVSAVDAWAVGGAGEMSGQMAAGLAEHWNGRHWVAATIPRLREGGQLEGVAAVSAREVWAVGSGGVTSAYGSQVAYALRWDGARWSRVPVPVPGMFHGLNAVARIPGTRQLWAVGFRAARPGSPQYPLIERWNGTHWTVTPAPAVTGGYLTAVTALSPVSAWAVGGIASPSGPPAGQVILHWNGTAWSRVPPGIPREPRRRCRPICQRCMGRWRRDLALERTDLDHRRQRACRRRAVRHHHHRDSQQLDHMVGRPRELTPGPDPRPLQPATPNPGRPPRPRSTGTASTSSDAASRRTDPPHHGA